MSRAPMSGIGSFQRDFSFSSQSNSSQPLSQTDWPPTPPCTSSSNIGMAGLDAAELRRKRRLEDIQRGLDGIQSQRGVLDLSTAAVVNKSNSAAGGNSGAADGIPAAKKKRALPGSWTDPAQTLTPPPSGSRASGRTKLAGSALARDPAAKAVPGGPAKVFLSDEQKHVLKLAESGKSLFYTGSAGTGKSVLLREIIKCLKKKHTAQDAVAITASTGIAACNIGGVTIHSFAGIGLGIEDAKHLAAKVKKNKKVATRWARTSVLIIDEVSMVDGDLFDKLSEIGMILRPSSQPFGGIQVVVTGDFFQLPPVTKGNVQPKFAFEANVWGKIMKDSSYNLTKVFRQKDQEFVEMLNEMRFGKLSPRSIARFKSLSRPIIYDDGLGPTELFPRREDVDRSNSTRMNHLNTDTVTYVASEGGAIKDEQQREKLLANFMAPHTLTLKIDAQVMLIKNTDGKLVNGSMGRVARFIDPTVEHPNGMLIDPENKTPKWCPPEKKIPVVEFQVHGPGSNPVPVAMQPEMFKVELPNGDVQAYRTQFPLVLAWAMSIHKSQGQTLDRVKVDLGRIFEKGQAYVALSRATSLEGLQVLNFDPKKVMCHPKVAAWSTTLKTVHANED